MMDTESILADSPLYKSDDLPDHIKLPFLAWFWPPDQDCNMHAQRFAYGLNQ